MAEFNARGNSTINAALKDRYGDGVLFLPTKQFDLQKSIDFKSGKAEGNYYVEAVSTQNEHGVTYAAPDDDAFALEAPIAGKLLNAKVQGAQHVLRSKIGINAVQSSKTSQQAFENIFDVVTSNMSDSLRKRIEIDLYYGQQSLATVGSISSLTITISAAEWASGIWAGAEGAVVEFYANSSGVPGSTKRTSADGTITAVDLINRTITITDATGVLATDHIVFPTQWTGTAWKTMLGVDGITSATAGDTLFNIPINSSSLWGASQVAVGSTQLSFAALNKASIFPIAKGFNGNSKVCISPSTWADLLNDEAAVRRHNKMSNSKIEVGGNEITFYVAQGTYTIKPSIYCKEGVAYVLPTEGAGKLWRVGTTDVTMSPLGGRGENFIERIPGVAGYEMLMYAKQALYSGSPGHTMKLTGIVNGTAASP